MKKQLYVFSVGGAMTALIILMMGMRFGIGERDKFKTIQQFPPYIRDNITSFIKANENNRTTQCLAVAHSVQAFINGGKALNEYVMFETITNMFGRKYELGRGNDEMFEIIEYKSGKNEGLAFTFSKGELVNVNMSIHEP